MKRLLSLICAGALLLSLAACGSGDTETATDEPTETPAAEENDYAGTTVTGKITAINGTEVSLLLGELTESEMTAPSGDGSADSGETPPEKPDGESTESGEAAPDKPDGESTGSGEAAPDKPDGESTGSGEAAPEKPDGESTESGETPPDKPDGESADSREAAPDKPDGESAGDAADGGAPGGMTTFTEGDETATVDLDGVDIASGDETIEVSALAEGDILQITFGDDGAVETASVVTVGGAGGSFGGDAEVTQGTSANTISEDGEYSGESYSSEGDDENALRVDGAEVTLSGITVDKSAGASSNTESGDFYGMNAALLATNGATVTITDAVITSSAQNGNGVFSYGSGTTVNITDSEISTTADNSGGIQTTGGGTTNAENLTVTTEGSSSAAIRSDRGGGTVNVDGGSYTSNGLNSPAVYSTADITVKNAELTANGSEALVIEGKNSITLENCTVYGNMSDTEGASSDENVHNIMIYQSMSGDADVGTSSFSMTGGTLTGNSGDLFYITNTACELLLSEVALVNNDGEACLMRICGNSASRGWGTAGANGAQVVFTADKQELSGDIIVDTISTLSLTLKGGSSFTGTINIVDNAEGGEAVSDNAVVTIESGCTWTLTGDCTISELVNNGTINYNGYTITFA